MIKTDIDRWIITDTSDNFLQKEVNHRFDKAIFEETTENLLTSVDGNLYNIINIFEFDKITYIELQSQSTGHYLIAHSYNGFNKFAFNWTAYHCRHLIKTHGFEIDEYTYGNPFVLESSEAKLYIGKFSSIGPNVTLILSNHDYRNKTSYPFSTINRINGDWPKSENKKDHYSKGNITIGSDVWIGANVTIQSGVTIADGAVVGAGSVVTKDVEPFSIVAGNPAKLIRFRFEKHKIDAILKERWWNWDPEMINNDLHNLMK